MELVGIPVVTIASNMSATERGTVMEQWNAPDSPLRVLILNTNVSSAGLNCHINCHVGIITFFLWNAATELQAMGRLFRINQLFEVV